MSVPAAPGYRCGIACPELGRLDGHVVEPQVDVNEVERAVVDVGCLATNPVAVLIESVARQIRDARADLDVVDSRPASAPGS